MTCRSHRPRAWTVLFQLRQQRLAAQSNFLTPQGHLHRRRVPHSSQPLRLSTRTMSRRPGLRPRTSLKAEVTTSSTIRPRTLRSSSWSRCGSPTKISSWPTRGVTRSHRPTYASGSMRAAAWRLRFRGARSTSMKQPTSRRPVAS